ncbi:MAG: autotransporter adhesin family protein [Spirochaetaceae bacterium]|jgi:hypothetical protein|nr:autotransporter adhesin family protein [Spirochaetaceae bacterium]
MKHSLFMVCAVVLLVMAGCPMPDDTAVQYDPSGSTYAETYWGEWIRMDADETWYISGGAIKINGFVSSKSVSLAKQSDRVVKVAEGGRVYYLYASRIANTSFTGKVAGFEEALASVSTSASVLPSVAGDGSLPIQRAVAGGKGWVNVVVEDLNNGSTKETQTDDEGEFTVEDAIPGDEYRITPEGGTPVTVRPQGDGDDVGTITVTDGVNFKTIITENDNTPYLYANGTRYDFTIKTTNIGTEDCFSPTYQLSFEDGLVTQASTEKKMWKTIEPGASETVNLWLQCDAIEAEYAYKKITITIADEISQKTWVESVTVKFYKTPTYFYLETDPSAATPVYGVVINPFDNKASRFQTGGENLSYVTMPWSSSGYLIVFSGATAVTEAVYALGVNRLPSYSDSVFENFNEPGRYEPNGTEQTACEITEDSMMAYLHKNDIDYYRYVVPCPEKEPELEGGFFLVPSSLSLDESLEWIGVHAVEDGTYAVTVSGDETVAPKTLSYSAKTVNITLWGGMAERTVSLGSSGALFTVGNGVTLRLGNNITLQGRNGNSSALVQVNSGGTLEMDSGSKVCNNTLTGLSAHGGGVYVNGGKFTMNGGKISGNSAIAIGGGVYVRGGKFTMNGGTISSNTVSGYTIGYGGGVDVLDGTFTMNNGEISGNSAINGGGVCARGKEGGATFTMNDGIISGNTASIGGGVYVFGGTFTKQSGGIIYGSNANGILKNAANKGHAVYVDSGSKKRNSTAEMGVALDSTKTGAAGGWE